jgi:hypothetical protein
VLIRPDPKPQPDGTLVKALARAWRWQKLLDEGVYASVSDIGDAENISKSYVRRILRLALLAPEIVEAILTGKTDQALMLEHLERLLPALWEEQRDRIGSPGCSESLAKRFPSPKAAQSSRSRVDFSTGSPACPFRVAKRWTSSTACCFGLDVLLPT